MVVSRWLHEMETFSALLAICGGNSPVPGEFPTQRPVTRSFDVFFDLHLNKRLSKQSRGWWFETPSRPLWRRSIGLSISTQMFMKLKPVISCVLSVSNDGYLYLRCYLISPHMFVIFHDISRPTGHFRTHFLSPVRRNPTNEISIEFEI